MVDVLEFEDVNKQLEAEGKEPAAGEQIMLGITKASLATDSFLSCRILPGDNEGIDRGSYQR